MALKFKGSANPERTDGMIDGATWGSPIILGGQAKGVVGGQGYQNGKTADGKPVYKGDSGGLSQGNNIVGLPNQAAKDSYDKAVGGQTTIPTSGFSYKGLTSNAPISADPANMKNKSNSSMLAENYDTSMGRNRTDAEWDGFFDKEDATFQKSQQKAPQAKAKTAVGTDFSDAVANRTEEFADATVKSGVDTGKKLKRAVYKNGKVVGYTT